MEIKENIKLKAETVAQMHNIKTFPLTGILKKKGLPDEKVLEFYELMIRKPEYKPYALIESFIATYELEERRKQMGIDKKQEMHFAGKLAKAIAEVLNPDRR